MKFNLLTMMNFRNNFLYYKKTTNREAEEKAAAEKERLELHQAEQVKQEDEK